MLNAILAFFKIHMAAVVSPGAEACGIPAALWHVRWRVGLWVCVSDGEVVRLQDDLVGWWENYLR